MPPPRSSFEHDPFTSLMLELAADLQPGHRFDFDRHRRSPWTSPTGGDPLLAALKDPDTGGIYVFSDEGQRVFDRQGTPACASFLLILDQNIRNTRQIATAFQPLVDHPMR